MAVIDVACSASTTSISCMWPWCTVTTPSRTRLTLRAKRSRPIVMPRAGSMPMASMSSVTSMCTSATKRLGKRSHAFWSM